MDVIQENYSHTNITTVIMSIAYVLASTILYIFLKYMISIRYHFSLDVLFHLGLFFFIAYFLSLIFIIIIQVLSWFHFFWNNYSNN